MSAARNTDLLQIDDELTDEERSYRDNRARLRPRPGALPAALEAGLRGARLRRDIFGARQLGVLGMHLAGYGCAGAGAIAYGRGFRELEACYSGPAQRRVGPGSLSHVTRSALRVEGTENTSGSPLSAGEGGGCFGLNEPRSRVRPGSMRTFAEGRSDWVLSGTKMWIPTARSARNRRGLGPTDEASAASWSRAVTPASAPDIHKKLSLRASSPPNST